MYVIVKWIPQWFIGWIFQQEKCWKALKGFCQWCSMINNEKSGQIYSCHSTQGHFFSVRVKPSTQREMLMLLNDIVKLAQKKPRLDWDAYCEWKIMNCGSLWGGEETAPVVWKCSCGSINSSVSGEKYATCQDCGLVFIASPR